MQGITKNNYDVIVIGAGGAGLMTSRTLGDLKLKVLLMDKKADILNVSFKTLGSFIKLDEFNLHKNTIAAHITKGTIYSKNFRCKGSGQAFIIDKVNLHKYLLDSIDRKFVDIKNSTRIQTCIFDDHKNIAAILDNKGNKYVAKFYVDATGLSGTFSKKLGLQDENISLAVGLEYNVIYKGDPNEVHFFIGKEFQGGYGWIFPLKDKRAILGFGSFENLVIKELKLRLNGMLSDDRISQLVVKDNDHCEGGSIPVTEVKNKFIYNNLICVGDSVSQVNPMVGEGYKYIFKSAVIASNSIYKAFTLDDPQYLSEYEKEWNSQFYNSYKAAKALQNKLARFSKYDWLMDLGILFLKSKRQKTFERLFSGEFTKRDVYLP